MSAAGAPLDGISSNRSNQRCPMIARLLNVLLRLSIIYFLWEVLRAPNDPRFARKAIPIRNLIIVGALSLLFPAMHLTGKGKRWTAYPFTIDNFYLSIFSFDMAGNSFDLYDRYYYFDLLPHFHGSGALAVVLKGALGLPTLSAIGLANMAHTALEAQEYYTDVIFGTQNVRGVSDTVNDLLAGLGGTISYATAYRLLGKRRR